MAKILLIDDHAELLTLVKSILERDGHQVTLAEFSRMVADNIENGGVASVFDLIIVDTAMPNVDGLEAIRLLKHANPRAKVLALSGDRNLATPNGLPEEAQRISATLIIAKPFSVAELFKAVASLLATP